MKKTVLIFDDDVNILELCSIILTECGYEVATSETSHNIIEKVSETHPDAILMDNWIPEIGGIEATRILKKHPDFKHIPVIYFSSPLEAARMAAALPLPKERSVVNPRGWLARHGNTISARIGSVSRDGLDSCVYR